MKKRIFAICTICLMGCLLACSVGNGKNIFIPGTDSGMIADEMFSTKKDNETIYIFGYGDVFIETNNFYRIDFKPNTPVSDGGFYKIVADVTYLNGGIAGYMNYPEIRSVHSCEEISIEDLPLPSIKEKRFGITKIGDYADGDYFLWARGNMAVWKNGEWIYKYTKGREGDNGTYICYRDGVTEEDIKKGISNGIVCCSDYFVMPSLEE